MKRLLMSVAILLFATLLFIHDDNKENSENLAKETEVTKVVPEKLDS